MIRPTVGRSVWYYPSAWDLECGMTRHDNQPFHAVIVYVWNDRFVNLVVYDHIGLFAIKTSVNLLQDDDTSAGLVSWAEWTPYQKGQAQAGKAEAQQLMHSVGG